MPNRHTIYYRTTRLRTDAPLWEDPTTRVIWLFTPAHQHHTFKLSSLSGHDTTEDELYIFSVISTKLENTRVKERIPYADWTKSSNSLLPARSWWIRSAKLGSSPHQNIHSSLRPGLWSRRQTLSTSAFRQRLKLLRMGSSSVTGKRIGADVGPCHTYRFHLMPVKSAWGKRKNKFKDVFGQKQSLLHPEIISSFLVRKKV